jgi:hypothetical protein
MRGIKKKLEILLTTYYNFTSPSQINGKHWGIYGSGKGFYNGNDITLTLYHATLKRK